MPLKQAAQLLCKELSKLSFQAPVTHVYNPLEYAWPCYESYLDRFASSNKTTLFLGMNPGPWGMAQTGVPFGEIDHVHNWMQISATISRPENEHPKRPVEGFSCNRSEVSGRRLWGLFASLYPKPEDFFAEHFVANWCPLIWLEETGRNRTPDKLPKAEFLPVQEACDRHLLSTIEILQPKHVIGVGGFAHKRLQTVLKNTKNPPKIGTILHPSPASPAANKGWAEQATKQLQELKIW